MHFSQNIYCSLHLTSHSDNLSAHQELDFALNWLRLVYRLQSKNCRFHLPASFGIPSAVQELQFYSPTACVCVCVCVWYTVSSPRIAGFTYRLPLVYRHQSKNCRFHLLASFVMPSPVQEPTGFVWYTVSSPRTAGFTYRLRLVYRLQSKNCSLHPPAVFGKPSPV
jgi:hypothetical protein